MCTFSLRILVLELDEERTIRAKGRWEIIVKLTEVETSFSVDRDGGATVLVVGKTYLQIYPQFLHSA
jgi:hypothetical protein